MLWVKKNSKNIAEDLVKGKRILILKGKIVKYFSVF